MKNTDPRVDAYIEKSAPFAQPVLNHIRKLIHSTCPAVTETMKWSFPHFEYKGTLCNMAAFKQHCTFGFWKGALMKDPHKIMARVGETAMGQFGRITGLHDLPKDTVLIDYIKEAMRLNEEGIKVVKPKTPAKEVQAPAYFIDALKKNGLALETFNSFSNSHRKEYIEWITEAKTEATRNKRMETAVEWLAEGKSKNWKYIKK